MQKRQFDLVIIGGGIHGAGVAQAAAAAGYSALLLEQTAPAAGTSSKSSKLIHGGLRYLENGQLRLVKECLYERGLLLKNAPDLVSLTPFHLPVYRNTSRRPLQIHAGLTLYNTLGGFRGDTAYDTVERSEWPDLDGLDLTELQKVFRYYDAQTDDKRLTEAVLRSAVDLGAEIEVPATFIQADKHNAGYRVCYQVGTGTFECDACLLVNAAGPWSNEVLERVSPAVDPLKVELIQGAHLILDQPLKQGCYYIEAPQDKRAVFVMPWQNKTLVGTTESLYHGNPAKVFPLHQEKSYLLETLAHYFPRFRHTQIKDIETAFAGLRVLPMGEDEGNAFSRPRETVLHPDCRSKPHLVTIYGGKLTAYRATAERLINQFRGALPGREAVADTHTLRLHPE